MCSTLINSASLCCFCFGLLELNCFSDIGNERANAAKFLEEYGCGQVDPTSKEFVEKYLSTFTGDRTYDVNLTF